MLFVRGFALPVLALSGVHIPLQEIAPSVSMPVISIGTGGEEKADAKTIVTNWMHLGGRGVDTALIYKDQRIVANAIAGAGVRREDVFITTKIPGCARASWSIEADLAQLQTKYIDLLLIHSPFGGNCSDTWAVLEKHHAKGVLRSIGVSNFNSEQLQSLLSHATVVPAVNQIRHNVLEHDDETLAFCNSHKITVEAYSPLGRGSGIAHNTVLHRIGTAHNVTNYQVAMRWILQHGHILTFQSTSTAHQENDADVFGFTLSDAEMLELDRLQEHSQAAAVKIFA